MKIEVVPYTTSSTQAPRTSIVPQIVSRRTVLRGVAGIALAGGMLTLDSIARKLPHASALTAWSDSAGCQGYYASSSVCVPSSAYFGSDNCSGTFHRNAYVGTACSPGTGFTQRYFTPNETACNGKNRWTWAASRRRCSDGYKYTYNQCNGQVEYDGFSICRTSY